MGWLVLIGGIMLITKWGILVVADGEFLLTLSSEVFDYPIAIRIPHMKPAKSLSKVDILGHYQTFSGHDQFNTMGSGSSTGGTGSIIPSDHNVSCQLWMTASSVSHSVQ